MFRNPVRGAGVTIRAEQHCASERRALRFPIPDRIYRESAIWRALHSLSSSLILRNGHYTLPPVIVELDEGLEGRNVEAMETTMAMTGRPLVDPYDRHVTYLRVSVTDRCDFRCVYCMAEDMTFLPKADVLTLEELDALCSAFVERGVRKLRLTGESHWSGGISCGCFADWEGISRPEHLTN